MNRELVQTRPAAGSQTNAGSAIFRTLIYGFILIGVVITVYPFIFMLSASFKTQAELFSLPPSLLPHSLLLQNYENLFSQSPYISWYINSVVVVIVRLAISLFFCSLAGFAFAKYEFAFKRPLFLLIIASILIPFEVEYIPLYVVMIQLHLVNTLPALFLPWAASGFGIFLMRQFMVGIPNEMIDAARVDGASGFRIYWQIALPLARPALGALTIVLFLATWTNFFWALIVITQPNLFTLPIGIASFLSGFEQKEAWGLSMSAAVLAALPLVAIFVAMQRQFLSGLTVGSVKG